MKKQRKHYDLMGAVRVIFRIVRDTKPIAHWLCLAVVICLLSVFASIAAPELLGLLTDSIYDRITLGTELDLSLFARRIVLLAIVYVSSSLFSAVTTYVMNWSVSSHFTCRLRVRMSEKIRRVPVKTVDSTPNGEIISRMTSDVSIMGGTVHDIFGVLINGVIRLAVISVVIFTEDARMALAVVTFVPLSLILSALLASRSEKHFDESRKEAGRVYALAEENLTGFDTVRAFGLEERQNTRYREIIGKYSEHARRGYLVSGTVQPVVAFINNLAYIVICVLGGYLSIRGAISPGALVSFVMYTKLFSSPLESIAGGMSMMQSAIASAKRVYEYLDGEEMDEYESVGSCDDVRGDVVFEDVCFSYTPDKPLIENLSLRIKCGQKVAIVGPTGGGKTTIVNLLMRFYDPTSGKILIDGVDISTLTRADVRERFGMVLQDTKLFTGTVYDNIAYGKEGASYEEVMAAAKEAHIDSFIEALPDGYDTVINEDSTNISGGQKQLLTIARAYLSNRPILILDEATSNVDTRTELLIQETMDELMEGRTAFVIAHRLSTIENADIILVVDNGHVVERGTHAELISAGGLYAKMHKSQYSGVI
ncbi:MAG: ABC transporter ATP-binding protein [Clostridia bacterium]|nr:ABC transporter ATP-binding protein [Clostridia bacterium]